MIVRFIAIVVALAVATWLIPGIRMTSHEPATDLAAMIGVAVIFGAVNSVVKPLFRMATGPLHLLLLRLALLAVNAVLLLLTSRVCGVAHIPWTVDGPLSALAGALGVSVVSFVVNSLFGRRGEEHR